MSSTTASRGSALPPQLQKALAGVSEISSLPEITARIVQVVEDPRATAHEMHDIVRADPALAAKILKVVNSAFYGLPSQIASLDRAILMLGLSAVKNIALAASLSRLFVVEDVSEQFAARDLWRHSVAVGVAARLLAESGGAVEADEAFVAGLVHDLGLVAMQQLFPANLREVVDRCHAETLSFCELERHVVGADHQMLGAFLAERWKFPPTLRQAIEFHHQPGDADAQYRGLATAVYVADTQCGLQRFGLWLTAHRQEVPGEYLAMLRVSAERLTDMAKQLPDRVAEAERIFTE